MRSKQTLQQLGTLLSSLSVSGNMDVTGTFTVSDNILMTGTGAIDVAAGTTAQRPISISRHVQIQ